MEFRSMPRAIAVALVLALHVSVAAQTRTREVVRRDNISIEVIAEGRGRPILLLPSLGAAPVINVGAAGDDCLQVIGGTPLSLMTTS
jgi:hypothetical protein